MTTSAEITPQQGRPPASLHYVIGKIDGKLDQVLLMFASQAEDLSKLGGRVSNLESWKNKMLGGGAALTFLITATEIVHVVTTGKP